MARGRRRRQRGVFVKRRCVAFCIRRRRQSVSRGLRPETLRLPQGRLTGGAFLFALALARTRNSFTYLSSTRGDLFPFVGEGRGRRPTRRRVILPPGPPRSPGDRFRTAPSRASCPRPRTTMAVALGCSWDGCGAVSRRAHGTDRGGTIFRRHLGSRRAPRPPPRPPGGHHADGPARTKSWPSTGTRFTASRTPSRSGSSTRGAWT